MIDIRTATHASEKTFKSCAVVGSYGQMHFDVRTPDSLCQILTRLHVSRERVVLIYGNKETGEVWENATPERGRIGRARGLSDETGKVPLLIRTSRSIGGEPIMDHCILLVRLSASGRVLWRAENVPCTCRDDGEDQNCIVHDYL